MIDHDHHITDTSLTTYASPPRRTEVQDTPKDLGMNSSGKAQDLKALVTKKVDSYEQGFKNLLDFTGEKDLDKFVATFISNEDKNFSLFKVVNDLNNEIENFEAQIFEMQT